MIEKSMLKNLLKMLVVIALGLIVLAGPFWVYGNGYISVSFPDNVSGTVSYELKNQATGNIISGETKEKSFKKLVPKGSYELRVTAVNGSNYFAVARSAGILKTTKLNASMSDLFGVRFVGDNPGGCMHYYKGDLLSYGCGTLLRNLNTHIPSKASSPTLTLSDINNKSLGSIEGTLESEAGLFVLVNQPRRTRTADAHAIHKLQKTRGRSFYTASFRFGLKELTETKSYSAIRYKAGFLVYSNDGSETWYYPSLNKASPGSKLNTFGQSKNFGSTRMHVTNDRITAVYSNESGESVVVIGNETDSSEHRFDKAYVAGNYCGTELLCLFGDGNLDVYELGEGKKPEPSYTITDVRSMYSVSGSIVVATKDRILLINADSRSGHSLYNLSGYSFASITTTNNTLVVNLKKPDSGSVALLLSSGSSYDSIDKKALALSRRSIVNNVSVNGAFIHVSPDLGEPVYIKELDSFGYSKEIRTRTAQQINDIVKQIGIDTNKYKIINTLP